MSAKRWDLALKRLSPQIYEAIINGSLSIPGLTPDANVYWVSSTATNKSDSASEAGESWDYPLATYAGAKSKIDAKANGRPNYIFALNGHAETVSDASTASAGITFDTADTHFVALGDCSITLNTATDADINIDAARCSLVGFDVIADFDSIVAPIDINAGGDDALLANNRFYLGSGIDAPVAWIVRDAGALGVRLYGNAMQNATAINPGVALAETLGPEWNYCAVQTDGTSATWNTAAAHETQTVAGRIAYKKVNEVLVTFDDTSGSTATLTDGVAGVPAGILASTVADTLTAGEMWGATTPAVLVTGDGLTGEIDSADVGYTVGAEAITAGDLVVHFAWKQLEDGALVLPGAGGTFA